MDCYTAASDLKKMLVAHSNAENQVAVLDRMQPFWTEKNMESVSEDLKRTQILSDSKISEVSHKTLQSTLDGDRSQDLHLSLRLSVSEGVRLMYNNYQNNKWAQVQATARNIIDSLEGDLDSEQTSAAVTSPMTSPPTRGSTPADKAADKWSMAFCEFYRDE